MALGLTWLGKETHEQKSWDEVGLHSDGDVPAAWKLSACLVYGWRSRSAPSVGSLCRSAVSGFSSPRGGSLVDIFCTHCQHLYSGQGKTLPFTWVWGTGVLDMIMSWMLIHTWVHYLSASHLFYFLYEPNAAWHLVQFCVVSGTQVSWEIIQNTLASGLSHPVQKLEKFKN